jgi:hypothetical protein
MPRSSSINRVRNDRLTGISHQQFVAADTLNRDHVSCIIDLRFILTATLRTHVVVATVSIVVGSKPTLIESRLTTLQWYYLTPV